MTHLKLSGTSLPSDPVIEIDTEGSAIRDASAPSGLPIDDPNVTMEEHLVTIVFSTIPRIVSTRRLRVHESRASPPL